MQGNTINPSELHSLGWSRNVQLQQLLKLCAGNRRQRHLSARGCQIERDVTECIPNVLTANASPPQNTTNADKSFEALLSHTIGELSKRDSVYRPNPEETSMVSQPVSTRHSGSSHSGVSSWVGVGGDGERYIRGIISELSHQLLIARSCCFPRQLISSVWSPQSIEFSLQQSCLPFLRLSCLLQHHLYGDSLTGCLVRPPASPRCHTHYFSWFVFVQHLENRITALFRLPDKIKETSK